jgi:signal transduction histidine kinase
MAARTAELAAANNPLHALDLMKSRFVTNVSHELRTPIVNLQFRMELLEHDVEANRNQHMAMLRQSMRHLETIIEDVLDLSRLDRDKSTVEFDAVNLQSIIRQVVDSLKPRAATNSISLSYNSDPNMPDVLGNYSYLLRVVNNLVANAINYTEAGTIKLQTTSRDGRVYLSITDTGIGIPPDDLPYIFDRFYRGQDVIQSNIAGTGLGLSIVKEIIDVHKGEIEVESVVGQGTTFRLWLPIVL